MAAATILPSASFARSPSGTFSEREATWNDGAPDGFKLNMTIVVSEDSLTYRGVNVTDPAKPIVTEWSGKFDGVSRPLVGRHFDHLAVSKLHEDEFMVQKLEGDLATIVEFWRYVEETDEWIRHGVVPKLENGKPRIYVEYFRRTK
ncbi:hypothetical protein [Sphingobium boeckii]|uniref:Uncharacterized protein n=1 Tax=Sphingobium boeckii TaxID=1082345 RepID=A0A7W9AG15_9SPHN|nr:hypothetical protein [Sphingobium boeckii]MBB5684781.1 hypothetical protein [Sphingobium boeckii]